jgi:hypothetical protein
LIAWRKLERGSIKCSPPRSHFYSAVDIFPRGEQDILHQPTVGAQTDTYHIRGAAKRPRNVRKRTQALTGKRKRIKEVTIRKPQRPHKQRQLTNTNLPTRVNYQRRTISELITHIHATRIHILTQRSFDNDRHSQHRTQREEDGGGMVGLGLVGRDGNTDCTHSTTHTSHYTPQEPQRGTLTPPPRPLDGRLGVGHRRIRHTSPHQHRIDATHTQK